MKLYLIACLRIVIGGIFLLSGYSKIIDLAKFAITIKEFDLLPDPFISSVALIIPIVELLTGVTLVLGFCPKIISGVAGGLMIVFITAIIPPLTTGSLIDCGCFGTVLESKVDFGLLIRDVIILSLILIIFTQDVHKLSIQTLLKKRI
jgi:putative oxidoreductase